MSCEYCGKEAVYKCSVCGEPLCASHVEFRTVCARCAKKTRLQFSMSMVETESDRQKIRELVERFWGEEEQLTFDKRFAVAEQPAFVAKTRNKLVGFISFAELEDAIVIVALGILPSYQGSGVGKKLIERVEMEAERKRKTRLLVSTSNDDLPALAFYQRLGFQIYEVKPGAIAEKHGEVLEGIGGLPVRDELRLRKFFQENSGGAGRGTRTRAAPKGHRLSRPAH